MRLIERWSAPLADRPALDALIRHFREADPHSAIRTTLESARPGDLVVLLAEPAEALPVIDS